jgi:hypothetical protein
MDSITLDSQYAFNELAEVLGKFELLITTYNDQDMIGRGLPTYETKGMLSYLNISMDYVAAYGNHSYTKCERNVRIPIFMGKVKLADLPVKPFFDLSDIDRFVIRGNRFKQLTQKPTFLHAIGFMYVKTWMGTKRLPINSRVVVDPEGYKKYHDADDWNNNDTDADISDDLCPFTLPCLPVYSLEYRKWGEVPTDSLNEIKFDETAFDRTILPENNKILIKNLVLNFYKTECCDFIMGKKRGLVFLLNGPPGVGKTLTAHGIAELSRRPLYTIGSGDIGTEPETIDRHLQKIFEMVGNWGGIVLVDEADVFMSKRTEYDINYNACVSVFLRLIETYFGILFLTTNRNDEIDPAFDSRIHVRLRYDELSDDGKAQVWNESLNRYKINNINVNHFRTFKLNNREIANIVQLAYILSDGDPGKVTDELINRLVEMRKEFSF